MNDPKCAVGEEEGAGECVADNPLSNATKDLYHSTKEDEYGSEIGSVSEYSPCKQFLVFKTHRIAPPLPPEPRQPIVCIAAGVAASKKPISEIGVGLPNVRRRFPAAGSFGLRYSFSKASRGIGRRTLSAVWMRCSKESCFSLILSSDMMISR